MDSSASLNKVQALLLSIPTAIFRFKHSSDNHTIRVYRDSQISTVLDQKFFNFFSRVPLALVFDIRVSSNPKIEHKKTKQHLFVITLLFKNMLLPWSRSFAKLSRLSVQQPRFKVLEVLQESFSTGDYRLLCSGFHE